MPQYVEVSVNVSQISKTYHYHLPEEFADRIQPGSLVVVPFGKQTVQGVVLSRVAVPEVAETRPVESILDEQPVLTALQMALAKWIAEAALAPLGACVGLMIPTGLSQRADILVQRSKELPEALAVLPATQKRIMALLEKRGELRGRQLDAAFRHVNWRSSLSALKRAGYVHTQCILPPPRVNPKYARTVQIAIQPEKNDTLGSKLSPRPAVHERRMKVLELLAKEPLPTEFSWVYAQTGCKYADLKVLAEAGLIVFNETEIWRDPLEEIEMPPAEPPQLTDDQQAVWSVIQKALKRSEQAEFVKPFLLHGVTGSGKTEIYLRAVAKTLEAGKQAIVLVPEISLTPQTVRRFMARFPNQVGIIHSRLSEGERYDTWRRARQGDLSVIIGARSALFVPLPDPGLIVLDECHHESYDQSDSLPYYHAVETAEAYGRLAGAVVLLGSATPRITQYYKAQHGTWELLRLPERILAHRDTINKHAKRLHLDLALKPGRGDLISLEMPKTSVVDMRQELKEGNRSVFSRELQAALEEVLTAQQQAILFLNRKGSATYIFCRDCGYVLKCPRDEKPLTYHSSRKALICHTCGYKRQMPAKCPECGSKQIRQLGTGTERLEKRVHELFPNARTLRWDADTTGKIFCTILLHLFFSAHRADILIGTQMLAKGLDLPLVTLVGVVLAEVGLNLPDFRAAERSFQVLTQVAGRAGRSPLGGKVIMQTYQPESYVIQAAAGHDFKTFYKQELGYRRALGYPPFSRLVKLEYRHRDAARVEAEAKSLAQELRVWIDEAGLIQTDFIGPVPCFFTRLNGLYRWQIILRGPDPRQILQGRHLRDWMVEVDPPNIL